MSEFNAEKIEIPSESLPFIDEADVIVIGGRHFRINRRYSKKQWEDSRFRFWYYTKETYRSRRHSSRLIIIAFNA
ncbi:hypothetical protein FJZ33_12705 [Candidatus Poribacteria bacterium]|nr:hypothetical protein [Candidatus Poribacteria bacterium]